MTTWTFEQFSKMWKYSLALSDFVLEIYYHWNLEIKWSAIYIVWNLSYIVELKQIWAK